MPPAPAEPLRDPEIVALGRALLDRRQDLTDGIVERIRAEVAFYRGSAVTTEDLRASCDRNLELILWPLTNGGPADLRPPRETGRRRAVQRAPLADVMAAYRVAFRYIWEQMVAEARERGRASSEALVAAASALWAGNDDYTDAMTTSYRETLTSELRHDERERTAMVEALLDGNAGGSTTIWEIADLLRLPASPGYAVVAAEVPDLAREALPGIEASLTRRGIATAWQLRPDIQMGIVCLKKPADLGRLVATLAEVCDGPVGISPAYAGLEQTASAVRLARIALAAGPPRAARITNFDDSLLAVTAVSASEVLAHLTSEVFGPLLELAPDDRATLLETLEAWRDNRGSATGAATKLYCHPNTVRHRIRRVEALTGRSLTDPRAVAELCMALEAVRIRPGLLGT